MLEEVRQIIEEVKKLPEPDKAALTSILVVHLIRDVVYYLVTGVAVILIGRRLISAISEAIREGNRERS